MKKEEPKLYVGPMGIFYVTKKPWMKIIRDEVEAFILGGRIRLKKFYIGWNFHPMPNAWHQIGFGYGEKYCWEWRKCAPGWEKHFPQWVKWRLDYSPWS